MSAPLTIPQKSYLARLARRAFSRARALALGRGEVWAADPNAWRHAEVAAASGKLGLRCCSQDDFCAVEAHFLELLGQSGAAFNAHVRAATESRRQAEAVLVRECAAGGFALDYAAAICRRQFKCSIFDASEKQLRCLIFTIRNRAAARRRAA